MASMGKWGPAVDVKLDYIYVIYVIYYYHQVAISETFMAVYTNFWEGTGAVYVYERHSSQTPAWPSSQPTIIESPTIKTGNRILF